MNLKNLQPIPADRSASTTILLTGFSVICLCTAILLMLIIQHTAPEITTDATTTLLPAVTQIEDPVVTALNILCKCSVALTAVLVGFHAFYLAYSIFIQQPCFRHWVEYPLLFLNIFITTLSTYLLPPLCIAHFGLTSEIALTITDLISTTALLAIIVFAILVIRDICNFAMEKEGDTENEA